MAEPKTWGVVYPSIIELKGLNSITFKRDKVGEVIDEDKEYGLYMGRDDKVISIRSQQTGRNWSISWEKLVELAKQEGLDG